MAHGKDPMLPQFTLDILVEPLLSALQVSVYLFAGAVFSGAAIALIRLAFR